MTLVPPSSRRPWLLPVLIVLGVLLTALGDRGVRMLVAHSLPTGTAQWIWEQRDRKDVSPTAFYAVRDFTLDTLPTRARLRANGDPEYILYLNGERIGAGGWREGDSLDVWDVGPLLQPGGNRLLAEVRSDHGSGGLLLSLQDAQGRSLVQTDESWRIFHQHQLGILRGWLPATGTFSPPSDPAACWGLPPLGRWGRPRTGPARALLSELTVGRPVPAASSTLLPGLPELAQAPERPHPPLRLFDWGREVTGYLLLGVEPSATLGKGLLYTGMAPPRPLAERPAAAILVMAGRRTWMDARPRRFRYALVVGPAVTAQVQEVDRVRAAGLVAPPAPGVGGTARARGVLGIVPPPLRTPVEDEVWRQLQGVARVAGKEGL